MDYLEAGLKAQLNKQAQDSEALFQSWKKAKGVADDYTTKANDMSTFVAGNKALMAKYPEKGPISEDFPNAFGTEGDPHGWNKFEQDTNYLDERAFKAARDAKLAQEQYDLLNKQLRKEVNTVKPPSLVTGITGMMDGSLFKGGAETTTTGNRRKGWEYGTYIPTGKTREVPPDLANKPFYNPPSKTPDNKSPEKGPFGGVVDYFNKKVKPVIYPGQPQTQPAPQPLPQPPTPPRMPAIPRMPNPYIPRFERGPTMPSPQAPQAPTPEEPPRYYSSRPRFETLDPNLREPAQPPVQTPQPPPVPQPQVPQMPRPMYLQGPYDMYNYKPRFNKESEVQEYSADAEGALGREQLVDKALAGKAKNGGSFGIDFKGSNRGGNINVGSAQEAAEEVESAVGKAPSTYRYAPPGTDPIPGIPRPQMTSEGLPASEMDRIRAYQHYANTADRDMIEYGLKYPAYQEMSAPYNQEGSTIKPGVSERLDAQRRRLQWLQDKGGWRAPIGESVGEAQSRMIANSSNQPIDLSQVSLARDPSKYGYKNPQELSAAIDQAHANRLAGTGAGPWETQIDRGATIPLENSKGEIDPTREGMYKAVTGRPGTYTYEKMNEKAAPATDLPLVKKWTGLREENPIEDSYKQLSPEEAARVKWMIDNGYIYANANQPTSPGADRRTGEIVKTAALRKRAALQNVPVEQGGYFEQLRAWLGGRLPWERGSIATTATAPQTQPYTVKGVVPASAIPRPVEAPLTFNIPSGARNVRTWGAEKAQPKTYITAEQNEAKARYRTRQGLPQQDQLTYTPLTKGPGGSQESADKYRKRWEGTLNPKDTTIEGKQIAPLQKHQRGEMIKIPGGGFVYSVNRDAKTPAPAAQPSSVQAVSPNKTKIPSPTVDIKQP